MQKKKIVILLSVVILVFVVGLFFVVGDRNIENTMAKNSDNQSLVETVDVVENLDVSDSVESSTEVPSVDTSEVKEIIEESTIEISATTTPPEVTESNGQLTNTEIPEQHEEGSYYVELAEDGSRKYSPQLITDCMGSEVFEGLTEEEIITVLNNCIPDNIIGDTYEDEAIRDKVGSLDKEWVYQLADKELPSTSTTTPSTPSTTTNNNSSTTNTTGNTSGGSSITPEVQPHQPSNPSVQQTQPEIQQVTPGRQFSKSQTLTDSGESWDGRKYN